MKTKYWSLKTQILHIGMVATVTAQLFISLIMSEPGDKGSAIGHLSYQAHEVVGLTALGIIALHWVWSISSQSDGRLKHLFPWWGEEKKRVISEVKALLRGQLPDTSKHGGLAGFAHGLGFLAVTGAAISGAIIFFTFPESGHPGVLGEATKEIHEAIAGLVWTYWAAHGGIAILHHLSGSDTLKKMFSFNTLNTKHNKISSSHSADSLSQELSHEIKH